MDIQLHTLSGNRTNESELDGSYSFHQHYSYIRTYLQLVAYYIRGINFTGCIVHIASYVLAILGPLLQ